MDVTTSMERQRVRQGRERRGEMVRILGMSDGEATFVSKEKRILGEFIEQRTRRSRDERWR